MRDFFYRFIKVAYWLTFIIASFSILDEMGNEFLKEKIGHYYVDIDGRIYSEDEMNIRPEINKGRVSWYRSEQLKNALDRPKKTEKNSLNLAQKDKEEGWEYKDIANGQGYTIHYELIRTYDWKGFASGSIILVILTLLFLNLVREILFYLLLGKNFKFFDLFKIY